MRIEHRDYERLLNEVDQNNLPDLVSQLLNEGLEVSQAYVIEAIRVLERKGKFKEAGKIAERAGLYQLAGRLYERAGKIDDAKRVRELSYKSIL